MLKKIKEVNTFEDLENLGIGRVYKEGISMLDFWVPGPKWQLLEALYYIYPKDKAKFKKMNKKELYAIYISARKQGK